MALDAHGQSDAQWMWWSRAIITRMRLGMATAGLGFDAMRLMRRKSYAKSRLGEGSTIYTWDKSRMPTEAEALPGRNTPMAVPSYGHLALSTPLVPPFPRGIRESPVRSRVLLGGGALLLGTRGGLYHCCGVCGRFHPESHISGGMHWTDRAQRGGSSGLQPSCHSLRRPAESVLGGTRSHYGNATRLRHRLPVPKAVFTHLQGSSTLKRWQAASGTSKSWQLRISGRSPPRSRERLNSTTLRSTTSSTWYGIPTGIATMGSAR